MAAENIEMQETSTKFRKNLPTWLGYVKTAAKNKYGRDITLSIDDECTIQLKRNITMFLHDLTFIIIHSKDSIPKDPCVLDITAKELNNTNMEGVESEIVASKNTNISIGTRYNFLIKSGVCFDHKEDLGSLIVSAAMTGLDVRVGDKVTKMDQAYNPKLEFKYEYKEKLVVPPTTKALAMIKTISKKHEKEYTLRFRSKRTRFVSFKYLTRRQQKCRRFFSSECCWCFGCCKTTPGRVTAEELLCQLPNYSNDASYCYFTLEGTLTWIGEELSVQLSQREM